MSVYRNYVNRRSLDALHDVSRYQLECKSVLRTFLKLLIVACFSGFLLSYFFDQSYFKLNIFSLAFEGSSSIHNVRIVIGILQYPAQQIFQALIGIT